MPKARRQPQQTAETQAVDDAGSWPTWLPRRLLSVDEVAQIFHVAPRTVRRWIDDGRLPCVRMGGVVRVRPETVRDFVNGQQMSSVDKL
jgi:excisionase family DNA binding protein